MNHQHAWDLIPWYVNGSASEADCERLKQHLSECATCRDELRVQSSLHGAMQTRPQIETMPHASLQKLWARVDAEPVSGTPGVARPAPRQRAVGWLNAAVVVQALLLGILALRPIVSPRDADAAATYQTVSTPAPAVRAGDVRAVFSPGMTLGELQALLERAHLLIVDGPSPDGVYTLAAVSAADDPAKAILLLRAHPAVRFAEPIAR